MALSELYGIGKRSRNPLAGVTKGARRGQGGRSLITPLDDADEILETNVKETGHDIIERQISNDKDDTKRRPNCMICRIETSKYNCPACNIAFCSLICYRSEKHESCSRPFLQKSLKEELGRNGEEKGMVDEDERKAMMDVLRRMNSLGADVDQGEGGNDGEEVTLEGEDGEDGEDGEAVDLGEWEFIQSTNDLPYLNSATSSDDASIEQLLSILTPEERARFKAAVEDQDPSQARAHSLLEKISNLQDDQLKVNPWWEQSNPTRPETSSFTQQSEKLSQQTSKGKMAKIEFNVLAVLLAYAYTVRYIEVHSLQDIRVENSKEDDDGMPPLEPIDGNGKEEVIEERDISREIVRTKLKQFAPFLAVSGAASRVLFERAEQVTLSFAAAQIDQDAAPEPAAKTLCFLYKDVQAIITQPRLVEVTSSRDVDRALLALSDLSFFLAPPSQKKLLFYSVYWLRLGQAQRRDMQEQVASEIKRLEIEMQRAEDQERFQAANEAIQQHTIYY